MTAVRLGDVILLSGFPLQPSHGLPDCCYVLLLPPSYPPMLSGNSSFLRGEPMTYNGTALVRLNEVSSESLISQSLGSERVC